MLSSPILSSLSFVCLLGVANTGDDQLQQWIQKNAIPVSTVEALNGFDDLEPLREVFGEARIISFGEETHGTREFFQMKHRLLEFLVEEMGVTILGLEASFALGEIVNAYVTKGEGTAEEVLATMGMWTWNTEELAATLEWMRDYNDGLDPADQVKFRGLDMQSIAGSVPHLHGYIGRVGPDHLDDVKTALQPFESPRFRSEYSTKSPSERDAMAQNLKKAISLFDENRDAWTEASSADAWGLAKQHLVVIAQLEESLARREPGVNVRDRCLALNAQWALEHEGEDSKMLAWSHNAHASYVWPAAGSHSMGHYIRELTDIDQVVIGAVFDRGGFQSMSGGRLQGFEVDSLPGSTGATLAASGHSLLFLDIRGVEAAAAAAWVRTPSTMRSIGGNYVEGSSQFTVTKPLVDQYDVLFFAAETSRAIPLDG